MAITEDLNIERKSFPPGEVLCEEGKACPYLYILLKGEIQVMTEGRVIQLLRKKGSIVGELSTLFGRPASTTLKTLNDSECLLLPFEYLEDLIEQSPEEEVNLLEILARRLLRETRKIPELEQALKDFPDEDENFLVNKVSEKQILLIAAEKDQIETMRYHFGPMGFRIIHEDDPSKIIQDFDDLDPEIIIFEADDFPRHWKPLLKLVRQKKSPEEIVFILITGEDFSFDEAAKAAHLDVNGIIVRHGLGKNVVYHINALIRRFKYLEDRRKFVRLIPRDPETFRFLFTHPTRHVFVGGDVADISLEGTSFIPANPGIMKDLTMNLKIPRCSLRIGKEIITVNCRVTTTKDRIGFEFESFEQDGHQKLFRYLTERPDRDMKDHLERKEKTLTD